LIVVLARLVVVSAECCEGQSDDDGGERKSCRKIVNSIYSLLSFAVSFAFVSSSLTQRVDRNFRGQMELVLQVSRASNVINSVYQDDNTFVIKYFTLNTLNIFSYVVCIKSLFCTSTFLTIPNSKSSSNSSSEVDVRFSA
jgi:hypothetical protein